MSENGRILNRRLKSFVAEHPAGWGHREWEHLLEELREQDLDAADEVAIGAALERERLLARLEAASVRGVGPKRREAIADEFGRLWDLEHASAAEIASRSGLSRRIAEEVLRAIRR